MKLKDYGWALEGIAALILLVGFVTMYMREEELTGMVIRLIGLGILFFTVMRIKPVLASRNEKDFIIIMTLELAVTLTAGIMMLFYPEWVNGHNVFSFSRLTGAVFYVRGIVHFYTTSKRYELHDLISFAVNILFISFGFLFLFDVLDANYIVWVIYALTLLLVGFFSYRSYNGYNNFRIQKENQMKMNDYLNKKEEEVLEDPVKIEDQINPKKIEEPKEEDRPRVDIN